MAIMIKKANKGRFHKALNVPEDKPIPSSKLQKALKSKSKTIRKEANFAKNAKKFNHK